MKINDFFEKGYYINLDRRPDRNEQLIQELKNKNLDHFFERVSAEDGINEPCFMKKHYYCAASYHKLFKKIYEEGHERVIVLEDDAGFYDDGERSSLDLISDALTEINEFPDWQILFFGGCPLYNIKTVSKTLAECGWVLGTHAVGYKRSVIEKVVKEYTPFQDGPIDGWYSNAVKNKYIINPFAIYQKSFTSDLDAHGHIASANDYITCYERIGKKITINEKK